MAERQDHPIDALQDALDDRLDASNRAALDAHLATCERCRLELDALRWTKRQLATGARVDEVPADLEASVRAALDDEDRRQPWQRRPEFRASVRRRWQWAGWAAAAAVIAAVVWVNRPPTAPSRVALAAADFRAFVAGGLTLDRSDANPAALEAWFRQAGLPFPARVFDFGMMDYRLAGGSLRRLAERPVALFAYSGPRDQALVCQMYEGTVTSLPAPADRRYHNEIEFLVYRERDLTVVFWQEGPVVCVLVANGDYESAIRLAFAKAVKV